MLEYVNIRCIHYLDTLYYKPHYTHKLHVNHIIEIQ